MQSHSFFITAKTEKKMFQCWKLMHQEQEFKMAYIYIYIYDSHYPEKVI